MSMAYITSDVQSLCEQAKGTINNTLLSIYLSNTRCVLAHWILYSNTPSIYWKPHQVREKLQAKDLFKDTHLVKLILLSNAKTIGQCFELYQE